MNGCGDTLINFIPPPHPILWFSPCPYPLQSLAELSTLQGLDDDHTFQKEVSLKTLVYKAYRSEQNIFVLNPLAASLYTYQDSNKATSIKSVVKTDGIRPINMYQSVYSFSLVS